MIGDCQELCDWAHPSVTSGKNGDVVTFTIDPNELDEKRIATFKFFTGSSVIPLHVESQSAYVMDLLSDEVLSIAKEKNTVRTELNTNVAEPTITYSDGGENWLTFDRRDEFGGKVILPFAVAANTAYKDRSTKITISSPLIAEPVNVNLTQKQTDAIILEDNVLIYDLAARTISFNVKYNVDYTISVTEGDTWITNQSVTEEQTGEDGLSTVTVSYALDNASEVRGGTIRIAKSDNTLINDLPIVQKKPNVELFEIPDKDLRSICISNKWVRSIIASHCILLEAGLNATSLNNTSIFARIKDLTGIENFPNLSSLELGNCTYMEVLDISGLHKVETLSFEKARNCAVYNLGDNPIATTFRISKDYEYVYSNNIKIISSKLESIDLSLTSNIDRDGVTSIDVSECPALKTLNANRSYKIKFLYLKTGQVIPDLTKRDATEIVYK